MGYITPETLPGTTVCRVLYIPDDPAILAAVNGSLLELLQDYNWTQEGGETAADTASFLVEMVDDFAYGEPTCGIGGHMIGEIILWPVVTLPGTDWLSLNGQAISRATYAELFAILGVDYGVGDGTTTFNLPDARSRGLSHYGQGSGLTDRTIGGKFGAEAVALDIGELAAHTHTGSSHVHTGPSHDHAMNHQHSIFTATGSGSVRHVSSQANTNDGATVDTLGSNIALTNVGGTGNTGAAGTAATGSAGSGDAHNNVGPEIAFNAIIKAL